MVINLENTFVARGFIIIRLGACKLQHGLSRLIFQRLVLRKIAGKDDEMYANAP